ncbi:MAG: hypothetical protein PGN13_00580 [Patulibacter minatonensis]
MVATPPTVEYTSPQISAPSRVSWNATWPTLWPGAANTFSEPIASPSSTSRAGVLLMPPSRGRSRPSVGSPGSRVGLLVRYLDSRVPTISSALGTARRIASIEPT